MADEVSKRLEAIQARVDAATPGPWEAGNDIGPLVYSAAYPWDEDGRDPVCADIILGGDDDAVFIAHSRADIPWLLNAVATLATAVQVAGGTVTETPTGVNVSGMPFLRMNGTYTKVDISKQRDVDHA